MIWLFFTSAVAVLIVLARMASHTVQRTREVNEGSEMEKGMKREEGEEVRLRRGSKGGSGIWGVGMWRVE